MTYHPEGLPLRTHIMIAAVLFGVEALLGLGLIAGVALIVAPVVLIISLLGKRHLQVTAIYFCLLIASFSSLLLHVRVAKRRAIPVITACKQFREKNGRYPKQLRELVPAFLPSVPNAKCTLIGRKFAYDETGPTLLSAAMFHGVFYYDFQTDSWKAND